MQAVAAAFAYLPRCRAFLQKTPMPSVDETSMFTPLHD